MADPGATLLPMARCAEELATCARWLNEEWGREQGYTLQETLEWLREIAADESDERGLVALCGDRPVGVLGSGRTETARLLFGLDRADTGEIHIHGARARLTSPRRAIARGLGMLPEDRQGQGLVADLSLRANIVLALQAKRGWIRTLPARVQTAIADRFVQALGIDTPDAERSAESHPVT